MSLHERDETQPVDLPWHPYVSQNQIDIDLSCEKFESLVGALRLDDLKASTVKLVSQIEPKKQFIFNHHDGFVQDAVLRCLKARRLTSAVGLPLLQTRYSAPITGFGDRQDIDTPGTGRFFVGAPF